MLPKSSASWARKSVSVREIGRQALVDRLQRLVGRHHVRFAILAGVFEPDVLDDVPNEILWIICSEMCPITTSRRLGIAIPG